MSDFNTWPAFDDTILTKQDPLDPWDTSDVINMPNGLLLGVSLSSSLEEVGGAPLNAYNIEAKIPFWKIDTPELWVFLDERGYDCLDLSLGMQALCAHFCLDDPGKAWRYCCLINNDRDCEQAKLMIGLSALKKTYTIDAASQWLPAKDDPMYPATKALLEVFLLTKVLQGQKEVDAKEWAVEYWKVVSNSLKESLGNKSGDLDLQKEAAGLVSAIFHSIVELEDGVYGADFAYNVASHYLRNICEIFLFRPKAYLKLVREYFDETKLCSLSLKKLNAVKVECAKGGLIDWQQTYAYVVVGGLNREDGFSFEDAVACLQKYCALVLSRAYGELVAKAYQLGLIKTYEEAHGQLNELVGEIMSHAYEHELIAIIYYLKEQARLQQEPEETLNIYTTALRLYYGQAHFVRNPMDTLEKPLQMKWIDDGWIKGKKIQYPDAVLRLAKIVDFLEPVMKGGLL